MRRPANNSWGVYPLRSYFFGHWIFHLALNVCGFPWSCQLLFFLLSQGACLNSWRLHHFRFLWTMKCFLTASLCTTRYIWIHQIIPQFLKWKVLQVLLMIYLNFFKFWLQRLNIFVRYFVNWLDKYGIHIFCAPLWSNIYIFT